MTGASSGLGESCSRILARHGAVIILCARRLNRLQALADAIEKEGGKAYAIAMDVNAEDSIANAFAQIDALRLVPDIVVNNAGLSIHREFNDIEDKDWEVQIGTNVKSVWRVSRYCIDRLIKSERAGSIINISSIFGLGQSPTGKAVYSTSKAAVLQLTRAMAFELAQKNIRVNAICPGFFRTAMNARFFSSSAGIRLINNTPAKRLGTAEDIAGPLLLLASNAGNYISGIAIPVDGGHMTQSSAEFFMA